MNEKIVMLKTISNYLDKPFSIKRINEKMFIIKSAETIQLLKNGKLEPIINLPKSDWIPTDSLQIFENPFELIINTVCNIDIGE